MPVDPDVKMLERKNGGGEGDETGSGKQGGVIKIREVEVSCDEI